MRSLNNNRKAMSERLYIAFTSILIVIVLGGALIIKANNVKNKHDYALDYYTKDLALIIEAMQAVPGDVYLEYPLEPGFYASIDSRFVRVVHDISGQSKKHPVHLLPGMSITSSSEAVLLKISKTGGTIGIKMPDQQQPPAQGCPVGLGLQGTPFSYHLKTEPPQAMSTLGTRDIDQLRVSLKSSLELNSIPEDQPEPTITITVTAEPARTPKGEIIIRRPFAHDDLQSDYQAIFCAFAEELRDTPHIITEEITSYMSNDHYLALVIAIEPNDKDAFMRERSRYTQALADAIVAAGGGAP